MKLDRVYVRFFRSFNFDYERKAHREASALDWERTNLGWYPFVRLDVDPYVTAVVGANESGKSHLLDAVNMLLTEDPVDRRDFCRYSDLYSVEHGERRVSDFAGRFSAETDEDDELMESLGYSRDDARGFAYVRSGSGASFVFTASNTARRELAAEEEKTLRATFPKVFRLETEVALPASMPISRLAGQAVDGHPDRAGRRRLLDSLPKSDVADAEIPAAWSRISSFLTPPTVDPAIAQAREKEFELGRSLLLDVARIDPAAFSDLDAALTAEREGEVNAIIQRMNDAIAKHLNFPKWWAQDRDFRLLLSPREREVAFTIRDRTETEYSFAERSRGLRYFLSYYVQLRANQRPSGREQLLLLDEPDAYLSGVGQQDLLRILEEFARPEDASPGGQVIYVTHSPYLINRNAAHRIRVLDKGSHDEGTRVVTDASRNHYEPLRSSLGPFVAETAFIGGANLFVEGLADQVLLAGVSSHLRSCGAAPSQTLNLNDVTIVPAGSAGAIPYLVFLARGRDEIKPPCVVLLDSDRSGNDAASRLRKSPVGRRAFIDAKFVLSVGPWVKDVGLAIEPSVAVEEPEDLIALPVAAAAARRYAEHVIGLECETTAELTPDTIKTALSEKAHVWDATVKAFTLVFPGEHIEKVGFAREVVSVLHATTTDDGDSVLVEAAEATRSNFGQLLGHLADLLHDARTVEDDAQQRDRVARLVRGFLRDHADGVIRDRARILFREIEKALEDTDAGDARRMQLADMRRRYDLGSEPLQPVPDYDNFKDELAALRYQERLAHQDRPQEPATPTEPPAGEPATAASTPRTEPQLTSTEAPATSPAANGSTAA
ncbi:AAA family ATPase [Streptomyces phaeochromogenes]|uniref:AAA family ATPase n=1 Tax=Streptomyces phaeochromogenes TaxID=1923 RepID=UPI0006E42EE5|nr:AAA family ATPase [Streptomyces phaeochromogenes]